MDRFFQQPMVDDVLPMVDDVLPVVDDVLPVVNDVLQEVLRVEVVSGLVTEVVTEARPLGVGSATNGLVTGSTVVIVGRPIIGLTPRLLIS
jgi:hypothetical protein